MIQDFRSTTRTQYHLFLPCLPQNSRLIVVDANDRTKKNYCINVRLSAWYGQHYYYIEWEVRYNSKHTCKPVRICSKCSEKNCLPIPTFTRCCMFWLFAEITCQTVYVTIQSHVTHVFIGLSVQCLITYAIYPIAVIVQNLSNQIASVLLK